MVPVACAIFPTGILKYSGIYKRVQNMCSFFYGVISVIWLFDEYSVSLRLIFN